MLAHFEAAQNLPKNCAGVNRLDVEFEKGYSPSVLSYSSVRTEV